jgi:DNA (cytosine-5)-methyltransferase 1
MTTGATLFTGGGGADLGMWAAGVNVVYGIEYDPEIAAVARDNGLPVDVGDILDVNPHALPYLDFIHASPPCPNFSVAKVGAAETAHDLALARKVADIVLLTSPVFFTLENVPAYRDSQSFKHIVNRLERRGYMVAWELVNAASYGVPQTRRRLWLRATRSGLLPPLPAPEPWVGWYAAIEDLLPTLPESAFAPWQLARLPEAARDFMMQVQGAGGDGLRFAGEPAQTVTSAHGAGKYRAFLLPATGHVKDADGGLPRFADEPAQTLRAAHQGVARAFIVDDQNNGTPSADGQRGLTIRDAASPVFTVSATQTKRSLRAQLDGGRVVAMTPRCLARFQSFPDSYRLPESNKLACRVIGNAVPPLLAEKICRGLLEVL